MFSCSKVRLCLLSCCLLVCCKALLNDSLRQDAAVKSPLYMQRAGLVPTLPETETSLLKLEHPVPHIADLPLLSQFPQGFAAG